MNRNFSLNEIRSKFLNYFKGHDHLVKKSSALIPDNDKSLLFTNSGMVQFKDIFTGAVKTDFKRVTTSQKCLRAGGKHNDLENVGYTARHHTFFEMLGNFSFGEYFKKDAIFYAWDFLTNPLHLALPKDKLYVTIYHNDDEAFDLWQKFLPAERILRITTSDNFWEMGDTGPCGPCSEIFYDYGPSYQGGLPGSAEQDDGERYIEIWNLVFMQFERIAGELHELPKKSIDTGMGLERIAAVCQHVHDNYQIDLFAQIINKISEESGIKFIADMNDPNYISMRVIADHLRSSAFLIADGILPGNSGREYVLRRIIRRAVIYSYKMGYKKPLIYKIAPTLIELMKDAYPELEIYRPTIIDSLKEEEENFLETIIRGFKQFEEVLLQTTDEIIRGEDAFKLYDTYGLPIDLTMDIAKSHGLTVDIIGFDLAMEAQKDLARASWKGNIEYEKQNNAHFLEIHKKYGETEFTGYEKIEDKSELIGILTGELSLTTINNGRVQLIFTITPIYAESGGQVSDAGEIYDLNHKLVGKILDVKKFMGVYIHECEILEKIDLTHKYIIKVNAARRQKIVANHSCAHILHRVLKDILGENVNQKGSAVDADKLRFDFNYAGPLGPNIIQEIERRVNAIIFANYQIVTDIMPREEAIKTGAMALFDEKYAEFVRLVRMGIDTKNTFSAELCGGTHARSTSEIMMFKITAEEAVAAGIRRIEGVTREAAFAYLNKYFTVLSDLFRTTKVKIDNIMPYVENLNKRNHELSSQVFNLKKSLIQGKIKDLKPFIHGDINLFFYAENDVDLKIFRDIGNNLLINKNSIYLFASNHEDSSGLLLVVSNDLAEKYPAKDILAKIATKIEFKPGGGNKVMASTGGERIDYDRLSNVINSNFS